MDYIEIITEFLGLSPFEFLFIFLFGYFVLKNIITTEKYNSLKGYDNIILSTGVGLIGYYSLKFIIKLIFAYIEIITFSESLFQYFENNLIILIIALITLILFIKELKCIVSKQKLLRIENKTNTLYSMFKILAIFFFLLSIVSYITPLYIITGDLLVISIVLISIIIVKENIIIHNHFITIKSMTIKQRVRYIIIPGILILGVILGVIYLTSFLFPQIEYQEDNVEKYVYYIDTWQIENNLNYNRVILIKEYVDLPVVIKRKGIFGVVPIEFINNITNEYYNLLGEYCGLEYVDSQNNSKKIERPMIKYGFRYSPYLLRDREDNIDQIRSVNLKGYRYYEMNNSNIELWMFFNKKESKLYINVTNNLDKKASLYSGYFNIRRFEFNQSCSIDIEYFRGYNQKYKEVYSFPIVINETNKSLSFDYGLEDIDLEKNVISFEFTNTNGLILTELDVNPHTELNLVLDVECKD